MTGTGFQDAAAILHELAEGSALKTLIASGTPVARGFQENMLSLRGTLLRNPPVITPGEARARVDQLISIATGSLEPFRPLLQAARDVI